MSAPYDDWYWNFGGGDGALSGYVSDAADMLYAFYTRVYPYRSDLAEFDILNDINTADGSREFVEGPTTPVYGQLYWHWKQTTATRVALLGYLDWDYNANVGIMPFGDHALTYIEYNNDGFWHERFTGCAHSNHPIPGFQALSLNVMPYPGGAGNERHMYFGWLQRALPPEQAGYSFLSGAVTAGTTVLPVTTDLSASLQPGQRILIHNWAHNNASANKNNCESKTVLSVSSSAITLTSGLSLAYDSGAAVGMLPIPVASSQASSAPMTTGYAPFTTAGARVSATAQTMTLGLEVSAFNASDAASPIKGSSRFRLFDANGVAGYLYGVQAFALGGSTIRDRVRIKTNENFLITGVVSGQYATAQGPRTDEQIFTAANYGWDEGTEYLGQEHAARLYQDENVQECDCGEVEEGVAAVIGDPEPIEDDDPTRPYARALKLLLPRGPVWLLESGSKIDRLLFALGDEFKRLVDRAAELIEETDPRTATETLEDWERFLGLPDDIITTIPATDAERRIAITQKLISIGGQSRAYFIQVAAACGYTVTIDDSGGGSVLRSGTARSGDALGNVGNAFEWEVIVSAESASALTHTQFEAVINRLKPAHTTVVFDY